MENDKGKFATALTCWLAAFGIATLAGTMLWLLGGWGFLQAAFMGFLLFLVLGGIFSWAMLRGLPAPNELELTAPDTPEEKSTPIAAAPTPTPVAAAAPAEVKTEAKPAAKKVAAKKAAPKKKATPAKPKDSRPSMMMDGPEGGKADDLKKITGVGPKLEQTLNDLGVWHYAQVAKFKAKDIAWVDERLRFKGRIERDDWVGQAKELAKAKG